MNTLPRKGVHYPQRQPSSIWTKIMQTTMMVRAVRAKQSEGNTHWRIITHALLGKRKSLFASFFFGIGIIP